MGILRTRIIIKAANIEIIHERIKVNKIGNRGNRGNREIQKTSIKKQLLVLGTRVNKQGNRGKKN